MPGVWHPLGLPDRTLTSRPTALLYGRTIPDCEVIMPDEEPQAGAADRAADRAATRRRSSYWFDGDDINGFNHRAWLKPLGFSDELMRDRPVVGIVNTWSELVGCNVHLRGLAEAVKRGVLSGGGVPLELPVSSLSETLMKPNAMMYRQLAAMDVEAGGHPPPPQAGVLLSCRPKNTPPVLMGAA